MPSRQVNKDRARLIEHRKFLEKERKRVKTANNAKSHADHALKTFLADNHEPVTPACPKDTGVIQGAITNHVRFDS